jgi:hypothetical protein
MFTNVAEVLAASIIRAMSKSRAFLVSLRLTREYLGIEPCLGF